MQIKGHSPTLEQGKRELEAYQAAWERATLNAMAGGFRPVPIPKSDLAQAADFILSSLDMTAALNLAYSLWDGAQIVAYVRAIAAELGEEVR